MYRLMHFHDNFHCRYYYPDVALNSGSMLRECIRHDELARAILNSEKLWLFFDKFLHLPNFDVASDGE